MVATGHRLLSIEHRQEMRPKSTKRPKMDMFEIQKSILVVMLAGVIGEVSHEVAHQLEAFAYLAKPCSLDEVTTVADRVLCACA